MYSPVLSQIKTREEKELLLEEIELLKQSLFSSKQNFDVALKDLVRTSISSAIAADLGAAQISKSDYLDGLEAELAKLRVLKLTIAFEPRGRTIDRLSDWIATNLGPNIILDLEEDSTIVGGAAISFQGEYRDFSLKSALDNFFSQNNQEVLSLLKSKKPNE